MAPLFRSATRRLALITLPVLLSACSSGYTTTFPDEAARPAHDVPDHFLVGSYDDDSTTEPASDGFCHSPMVDPRDGRRLRLVRAAEDRGDYEAPSGSYGLEKDDLLRLECSTGRAIGIIRRR